MGALNKSGGKATFAPWADVRFKGELGEEVVGIGWHFVTCDGEYSWSAFKSNVHRCTDVRFGNDVAVASFIYDSRQCKCAKLNQG